MFLLLCAAGAAAQPVSFGALGGVRPTDPTFRYDYWENGESRNYLVGGFVALRLPHRFSFEAETLYNRLGYTSIAPLIGNETFLRTRADAWEFPLLLKYSLPRGVFVDGGFVPRYAAGRDDVTGYYMLSISTEGAFRRADSWHAHDHAWTVGGGREFRRGRWLAAPEVRYLRWDVPAFPHPSNLASRLPLAPDEAQILLRIGWGGATEPRP